MSSVYTILTSTTLEFNMSHPPMCNYTPSEPACLARSMHGVSARSVLILGDDWWLHLVYDCMVGRTSQVMTRLAIEAVLGDKCQS
jgi:hypothetical protein